MVISLLPETAWLFFLIFARVGTMIMLMPAIGEQSIPATIRLAFALTTTLVMFPLVSQTFPPLPTSFLSMVLGLLGELAIGFVIGLSVRMILSALQVAGTAIAFQMGLGFAMNVDPSQGQQGVLIGNFLVILAITLIFVSDLHHLAIGGLYDSYRLFRPGVLPSVGDVLQIGLLAVVHAFQVAMQIAAPFILFGLVFYLGLGVLSRLMPQLQIFFIAMPANILAGLVLLAFLLAAMMAWYLTHVENALQRFLVL